MGRIRRKRMHHSIRDIKRRVATKNRTKDLDQIHDDLKKKEALKTQEPNIELPGLGQHYCVECAKHFIDDKTLQDHTKSKVHRRRVKELKDGPYTQKDAEEAVGLKTDNGPGRS
ncbi:hypothetical protein RI367_006951 [Sorochytrium milnesiophthora]